MTSYGPTIFDWILVLGFLTLIGIVLGFILWVAQWTSRKLWSRDGRLKKCEKCDGLGVVRPKQK